MATLADLKTRVENLTGRDDLATDLADVLLQNIQDACEFYGDERFWFNSTIATATTTANVATVTTPTTIRIIDRVTIPAFYNDLQCQHVMDTDETAGTGVPAHYAVYGDSVKLWPTPDAVYTLRFYGTSKVAAPTVDADTSIWTNEAAALIAAHAAMTLYRDHGLGNDSDVQRAIGQVQENVNRLRQESQRRMSKPLRPAGIWGRNAFNITTG